MLNELKKYKDSVFSNVGELFGNEPAPWTGAEIIEYLIGYGDSTADLYLGTDRYGDFGIMHRETGMEMKLEEWTPERADTLGVFHNWGAWEYDGTDCLAVNITGDADSEYGWQTHVLTAEDLKSVIDRENM